MSARGRAWLCALVCVGALGAAPERPPGLGDVAEVRHWSYPDYTRVVVELDRTTPAEVKVLGADAGSGKPTRLYFDLAGIWVGRSYADGIRVGDGLLQGVRLGQNTRSTTRVVLDVERYDRYRILHLEGPPRVVVDVYGGRDGEGSGDSTGLPMELRPIQTVVIDPGHGGKDPGAVGIGGLREKDVTLALAKAMRTSLEKRGFKVVLTRTGDRTLSLLERTASAEGARGDVFISLHANAARRKSVQGVEIYTLDRDAQRQTRRLAARENGVAPGEVDPLQHLLAQLRVGEVSHRSLELAELMQEELQAGMGRRWPSVKSAKIRQGPFYVLYLSDMPSILLEAEFLTHRRGAKRLRDPDYLRAMSEEVADAMGRFRSAKVAERRP